MSKFLSSGSVVVAVAPVVPSRAVKSRESSALAAASGLPAGLVQGRFPENRPSWKKELRDAIPLMSSSLVILFGVVKQFCWFQIWSEIECKTPAEYGPQYISTPPPPPVTHYLYILHIRDQ
jgi:hypothetical protein